MGVTPRTRLLGIEIVLPPVVAGAGGEAGKKSSVAVEVQAVLAVDTPTIIAAPALARADQNHLRTGHVLRDGQAQPGTGIKSQEDHRDNVY